MTTHPTTREWNPIEFLKDEEAIRLYIEAAQAEASGDAAFMAKVLGDVARARHLSELARETGITRDTLYQVTQGEGNPTMATVEKLARALGFQLSLPQATAHPA